MKRIISVIIIAMGVCFICCFQNQEDSSYVEKREEHSRINTYTNNFKLEGIEQDAIKEKLELLIANNELKELAFDLGEKVICIYEGEQEFDVTNYKFAIYKEDAEKNIVFVNVIFIEEDTKNIYTWKGDSLVQIGNMRQSETELDQRYKNKSQINLLYENVELEYLLERVTEVLKENGYEDLSLIYDDTIEFVDRKYHVISSFKDYGDHIIREESYYVDMENGNLYREEENSVFLRSELYYVSNLFDEKYKFDMEVYEQEEIPGTNDKLEKNEVIPLGSMYGIEKGVEWTVEDIKNNGKETLNESGSTVGTDYFFHGEQVLLRMDAEYYGYAAERSTKEEAEGIVYLVKKYEKGDVYRLAVGGIESDLGEERLNIYFYVTNDRIYRLWSYVYEDNKLISFYDDDEFLVKMLDTDEKLINNGEVVCQSENVICELEPGEHGKRFRITNNGDTIVYSRSDVKPNGDPGYCETFIWEKGKGLIKYTSKYGIEAEILYLTEIEISDE